MLPPDHSELGSSRMKPPTFYPFFAAAYPVLAATAGNTHLGVTLSDLWFPLVFALGVAAIVWLGTGTFFQDPPRRALVATLVIGFLFWYGYLFAGLRGIGLPAAAILHEWVFPAGAALTAAGVALAARAKRLPDGLTRYLNLAFGILLLFPVLGFGRHLLDRDVAHEMAHPAILEDAIVVEKPAYRPDIYLIVLDAYTGSRSLEDLYGFDNSEFKTALRERGFIVPRSQRSNYVVTFLTLASILNWDYVHRLVPLDPESADQAPVYPFIENNRTVHVLKRVGYRFVFLPTSFPMSNRNRFADIEVGRGRGCCNLLVGAWLRTTAFFPMYLWAERWMTALGGANLPFHPESVEQILWKFDQLERLPDLEGPLFVFAHLILPHEPFHFHADCTVRQPIYWPLEITPREEERVRRAYVEQLECTNRLVLRLVDRLLDRSDTPPVILLQSDHGYARFDLGQPLSLARSRADQVAERTDVFAAYHLPGVDPDAVPEDLTAVNLFRLVLREYFEADLPLIEDVTYWSALRRPYDLVRVWPSDGAAP